MINSRSLLVTIAAAWSLDARIASFGDRGAIATIQALQFSDTSVTGGGTVTVVVVLASLASAAGDTVSISSFPRVGHPPTVVVLKGSSQATFSLTTTPTTATHQVTITATSGASQKSASLTIRRPVVRSISLSPSSIQGGRDTLWMTVALDGVAPAGGIPVSFMTGPPGLATVGFPDPSNSQLGGSTPSEVPAGATQAVLPLKTPAVRLTRTVLVTTGTASATFELRQPSVSGLYLSSVSGCPGGSLGGGQTFSGPRTVPAWVSVVGSISSNGAFVSLTSDSPSAVVPATLEITQSHASPAFGLTYFECFDIQLQPVTQSTFVMFTATAGGATQYRSLVNLPRTLASLVIPDELLRVGQSTSLNIALTAPAGPGGTLVTLTSSNPAVAALPATITVPENSLVTRLNFPVTMPASDPDIATGVVITASFGGRALADTVIVRR